MTVRIGHASKDECGKATGGADGDQTGRELCVRSWYRGGWKVLLRPKEKEAAKKIAKSCEDACKNENLGYDQSGRNTGLQAAKKAGWNLGSIEEAAEFDCSSLVTACVQAAGIAIWNGGNAPTTRTLEWILHRTGAFLVLTDSKYLTGTGFLRAGDILLSPGSHVVIVLDDGVFAVLEQQGTSGNKTRSTVTYSLKLPLVQSGDAGETVRAMQQLLLLRGCDPGDVDGKFGKNTKASVEKLQESAGIEIDGKVGGDTWAVLLGRR